MQKWLSALLLAIALLFSSNAHAEVVVTFYSHEGGGQFPHALLGFKGTVDGTGEVVDTNYGFTAKSISPGILWGSVTGIVETAEPKYLAKATPHFAIHLTDEQYAKLMAMVDEWRSLPGKSYNLGKRNCVHFTMEAAALLGLHVNRDTKFVKKPKSFMLELKELNPELKLEPELVHETPIAP